MRRYIAVIILFLCPYGSFAAVNDIFPTDYVSNKPGSTVVALYVRDSDGKGIYRNGKQVLDESVHSDIGALRLSYTTQTFGYSTALVVAALNAKVNFEGKNVETANKKYSSGFADTRVGFSTWVINDDSDAEYLAFTSMFSLPTGQYDGAKAFNIGENRYKAIFGAGYVNRFMNNDVGELFVELSPEIAYYGANSKFQGKKLEQKPSFAMTGYLRYRPITSVGFFAGGQTNTGGETIIDGKPMGDSPANSRIMGGVSVFVFGTQMILRGAKDVSVYNGFKNINEVTLRLQKTF